MAKVLALIPHGATGGEKVREAIEQTVPEEHIEIHGELGAFFRRLREPLNGAPVVVLFAATTEDLAGLAPVRDFLEGLRMILLLPNDEEETIAKGYKLHPHVVGQGSTFLAQLPAVLSKILKD